MPCIARWIDCLAAELDAEAMPRHVAVLADGNRRWARMNAPGQPLVAGYQAGADKLKDFVGWCHEIGGIQVVTLWVLSTDNLSRSEADELNPLLEVITQLVTELAADGRWRVQAMGDMGLLPATMAQQLEAAKAMSNGLAQACRGVQTCVIGGSVMDTWQRPSP